MISLYNFWQARPCYYHASIILTLGLNFEIISSNICRWHLMWIYQYPSPIIGHWNLKINAQLNVILILRNLLFFFKGPPLFCRDHIRGTKWGLDPLGGGVQSSYLPALKACFNGGAGFFMPEAFYMGSHCFFCVDIK